MTENRERAFKLDELFFSITDKHGKILSGNEVFARVSGYVMAELRNRPHSIVRHPDMPRVVFRLLWDAITDNRPIAAYVKNRAKDGSYYWVLAYVTPINGEYLSVRFKPTTPYHQIVQDLYARLRAAEIEIESRPGGTKQEAIGHSTKMLAEELQKLGFSSYQSFIETALYAEYCNRNELIHHAPNHGEAATNRLEKSAARISDDLMMILARNKEFLAVEKNVESTTSFIASLSSSVQMASLNLSVKSERSSTAGEPLAVVANWLRTGSEQVQRGLGSAILPVRAEMQELKTGLFSISTSHLQISMIQYFLSEMQNLNEAERGYATDEAERLIALLAASAQQTFLASLPQLKRLGGAIRKVNYSFSDLKREVMGLGLVHVNGRVECSRMSDAGSFEVILQDAIAGINEARDYLGRLEESFIGLGKLMAQFDSKTEDLESNYRTLCTQCAIAN